MRKTAGIDVTHVSIKWDRAQNTMYHFKPKRTEV